MRRVSVGGSKMAYSTYTLRVYIRVHVTAFVALPDSGYRSPETGNTEAENVPDHVLQKLGARTGIETRYEDWQTRT